MADKDLSFRSYNDLKSLDGLKLQAKNNDPQALETVAKQFESLFINMLMQNSRKANESLSKDSYFDSGDTKFYRDMLDQQLSLSLSSGKGIGISDVLVRQLSPDRDKHPSADVGNNIERQLFEKALDATAKAAIESVAKRAAEPASVNEAVSQDPSSASRVTATDAAARVALNELPELRPGDFVDAIRAVEAQLRQELTNENTVNSSAALAQNDMPMGRFDSPAAFVQGIYPLAQEVAGRLGVDARVLVAQAALETGWGQSMPHHADGSSTYNLFGIKADQRWDGNAVMVDTLEFRDGIAQREKAAFRSYDSYGESLQDYVSFIQNNGRYASALSNAGNGSAYVQELQLAGYATDPEYATKITGILNGDILQQALRGLGDA